MSKRRRKKKFTIVQVFQYCSDFSAYDEQEAIDIARDEEVSGADVVENCTAIYVWDEAAHAADRLAEQAPELLEALRFAHERLMTLLDSEAATELDQECLLAIEAVIAKAEG